MVLRTLSSRFGIIGLSLLGAALLPGLARGQTLIPDGSTCRSCKIEARLLTNLGDVEGAGALPGQPHTVTVDGARRYWVLSWSSELPLVYSATGKFIAAVGRRGSGPGEFNRPETALALPGDSMLVVDFGNGVATVLDRALQARRAIRIGREQVLGISSIRWPRAFVNSIVRTSRERGWPLHLVDMAGPDGRIVKSFGLNDGVVRRTDLERLGLKLAASRSGSMWGIDELRYRFTEWDSTGTRRRTLVRKPVWFPATTNGLPGGPNKPAEPRISALAEDSTGRLWVFTLIAAPGYQRHWRKIKRTPGISEVSASSIPSLDKLYRTRIEVIDPNTASVVASATTPRAVIAVLPGGRVATYAEREDGSSRISILALSLRR